MVNQKKGPKKRPWQVSKKKVTSHSVFETQERKEMTRRDQDGLPRPDWAGLVSSTSVV